MIGKVYNIADFRVEVKPDTHGFTFSGDKDCHHKSLTYEEEGQIITCKDCNKQVTAWWAFLMMCRSFAMVEERQKVEAERLKAERDSQIVHHAALKFQEMIRKRKYFPMCPHCSKAIDLDAKIFSGSKSKEYYRHEALPLKMKANLGVVGSEAEDEPNNR